MIHTIWPYAAALIPFLGAGLIFYVIMKGVLEGDRRERIAQRKWDAEHGQSGQLSNTKNGPPE
jgi:hypothetical protein